MIYEEELEKRQNKVLEIIKDYIKPSLLSKTWNTDGIIVTNKSNNFFYFYFPDFNEQRKNRNFSGRKSHS